MGSTMGSYFGLLFLIAAYTAIGIFTSTLSENQIVAFIISVFLMLSFSILVLMELPVFIERI